MVAITPTLQSASPGAPIMNFNGGVVVATWAPMAYGTPGGPVEAANFVLNSVQIIGTFGVGGSVQIEGSNDGTNWAILPDINDDPAVLTGAGVIFFNESTVYVRANVTVGDGTTAISAIASLRRQANG